MSADESYQFLLNRLRADIKKLNLDRKKLSEEKRTVLDFVEGKKTSAQIVHNNQIILLKKGNHNKIDGSGWGFEHILHRHYGDHKEGRVSARDILNMFFYFSKYRETSDVETVEKNKKVYQFFKTNGINEIRIRLVSRKNLMIYEVTTFYSDLVEVEEVKETGDLF